MVLKSDALATLVLKALQLSEKSSEHKKDGEHQHIDRKVIKLQLCMHEEFFKPRTGRLGHRQVRSLLRVALDHRRRTAQELVRPLSRKRGVLHRERAGQPSQEQHRAGRAQHHPLGAGQMIESIALDAYEPRGGRDVSLSC